MGRFLSTVTRAFWAMLPAYVPNNAAVLLGGDRPIDGGRTWGSNRVLGDGKTWRGTLLGTACGLVLALLLNRLRTYVGATTGLSVPRFGRSALTLPLGAMGGDMAASFYKRRSGRDRGAPVPGLDQLDFVLGALSLTALLSPKWFRRVFRLPVLLAVLVLTPLLHVGTNLLAYLFGLKDEPY
jgi:CDP-2,3-bis-(O-geranylgeranyl)-sn-glycerol synthase